MAELGLMNKQKRMKRLPMGDCALRDDRRTYIYLLLIFNLCTFIYNSTVAVWDSRELWDLLSSSNEKDEEMNMVRNV